MINPKTLGEIKQDVAMMVDEIVASNLFNDSMWVSIFNNAMSYIYGYHKWSWNIKEETITLSDSNTIDLNYPIQEVIKVSSNDVTYTQSQYYLTEGNNEYRFDGKTITLSENITGDVMVVYRRRFNPYTTLDIDKQVDLPFWLNDALMGLMQVKILPIWLGEGAGGLMNNYLSDVINQLERYKMMDTYAEATRNLAPNRR